METVKDKVLVFAQPEGLEPVTVYMVVTVGLTTVVGPVVAPGFQVYDAAPIAVRVELLPIQIIVGLAVAVIVGLDFALIEMAVVEVQ